MTDSIIEMHRSSMQSEHQVHISCDEDWTEGVFDRLKEIKRFELIFDSRFYFNPAFKALKHIEELKITLNQDPILRISWLLSAKSHQSEYDQPFVSRFLPDHLANGKHMVSVSMYMNNVNNDEYLSVLDFWLRKPYPYVDVDISGEEMSYLPDSLFSLKQLRRLSISFSGVSQLPETIGKLTQLQYLDLSFNDLVDLPDSLVQLLQLRELSIQGNSFPTIPSVLHHSYQMQHGISLDALNQLPQAERDQFVTIHMPSHESLYVRRKPQRALLRLSKPRDLTFNMRSSDEQFLIKKKAVDTAVYLVNAVGISHTLFKFGEVVHLMTSMDFIKIITVTDLAKRLNISREKLIELSQGDELELYHRFKLKKKRGGYRLVQAPEPALKQVQMLINRYLSWEVAEGVHDKAHGFVREKSIVTNASKHVKKSWVLNFDLENFFASFRREDVFTLFMNPPFSFDLPVAQLLTRLCTTDQGLPQGAPTSPMLSNLLSRKLDEKLSEFAKHHYLTYTRYADDISFSSNGMIPAQLLTKDPISRKWILGNVVTQLVNECGFYINERKTRLQTEHQRQEVTGIIVNEKPNIDRRYVRNLRAMIHAYKKYGFLAAFKFINHYANTEIEYNNPLGRFLATINGRIAFVEMVKGKDNPVVLKLKQDFEHAKVERRQFTQMTGQ